MAPRSVSSKKRHFEEKSLPTIPSVAVVVFVKRGVKLIVEVAISVVFVGVGSSSITTITPPRKLATVVVC